MKRPPAEMTSPSPAPAGKQYNWDLTTEGTSAALLGRVEPPDEETPSGGPSTKCREGDENALLKLLNRWREEAEKAGHKTERIAVAFEAGRDGFWLARWLRARSIETHVIHASSVAVSREHRRAKTDRLDTEQLELLAARRAGALQDGRDPDYQRRRSQAAQPRAPEPRRRANSGCE